MNPKSQSRKSPRSRGSWDLLPTPDCDDGPEQRVEIGPVALGLRVLVDPAEFASKKMHAQDGEDENKEKQQHHKCCYVVHSAHQNDQLAAESW